MLCPVYRKEYSLKDIGDHIDLCISLIDETINNTPPTPKRSLSNEENIVTNLPKRHKKVPAINIRNMNQQTANSIKEHFPLAEKMRPASLVEYIGQQHVVGFDTVLQQLLTKGHIPSMIFWGPPGCGKSSLANVISNLSKEKYKDKIHIVKLSATSSGVSNIREAVTKAKNGTKFKYQTVIFMDEIHRFNKLQQDIFLPHVEAGTFTLIGTTTENPSYSLNSALLSRCRVFALSKLTTENVVNILCKATSTINGEIHDPQKKNMPGNSDDKSSLSKPYFSIDKTVIEWLAEVCDGDARVALNGLELAIKTKVPDESNFLHTVLITLNDIKDSLKRAHMLSDGQTNNIHHLYSALHKSIKAGKQNAALYWLARIMATKQDPVDIARRLVRISSEDVGLADADALGIAVHTLHGCQMIGMPECDVILAQCVVYLTRAPKSELMHKALESAKNIIINHKGPQPTVPLHIRDRSGQRKLQAISGRHNENLLRKEETVKTRLPHELQHVNFFLEYP